MSQNRTLSENLLSAPLTLPSGEVLQNRLAKAAMSETLATYHNHATAELVTLYQRWAGSGAGLIITGNVMVDRRAIGEPRNVVIEDETDLPILRQWADAATSKGVAIWAQINHPGKQSTKGLNAETISASAVPFREDMEGLFATPREATVAEIEEIILRFGHTAAICKKAGFSGVQIHGAHGYLVSQFLSPHHNRRTDDWGGTPEKRQRFMLEVYKEIRRQVGPEFSVGVKLNSADFQRGGFTEEESLAAMRALAEAGIDMIEISGGTYEAPAMSGGMEETKKAATVAREAYFLEFAEKARAAVSVPLMVTGGFRSVAGMNAALASAALDIVGVARLMAVAPEAPVALLAGKDAAQAVKPILTGIGMIDKLGIMEIMWYEYQLALMAAGGDPHPRASGLWVFLKSALKSGWGTYRTRRARR
ncbi:MAG: NADH:flavin oxidoreductase/NADH oxidase family protein [Sphingorhabdus sp.]|nr:NADH:flavin oxidoreductase/NADH oxidase family protein [Sphingorhabdus sp.]